MVWLWCCCCCCCNFVGGIKAEQVRQKRSVLVIGPYELLPMSYGQKCFCVCMYVSSTHNINTNRTKRTKKRRKKVNERKRMSETKLITNSVRAYYFVSSINKLLVHLFTVRHGDCVRHGAIRESATVRVCS